MKTSKAPIDLTGTIPQMRLHEFMSIPTDDVNVTLTGNEMEFILASLSRLHTSLVETVKDKEVATSTRKEAYDFALSTEHVYASIFRQLKLYKPERQDLH